MKFSSFSFLDLAHAFIIVRSNKQTLLSLLFLLNIIVKPKIVYFEYRYVSVNNGRVDNKQRE